ncbi:hypothetical protein Glove_99g75 [Diversispora epigaea]|uniref:Uncharacterized protein n=1 Tax=Diversispora epigaea TaxID=1348612 RepID=A0A397JCX5_9GLOM|nr:hypothetical protein Glove_99g75 [Diversispora epigaea]
MVQLLNRYTLICKDTISNSQFIWDISSCICDFRVNIHECPETEALTIAHWILIPYCLMLCLTSIICLYHLMYIKKESFFFSPRVNSDSRISCGFLRTRPQHTFYVTVLIYCSVQVIHSICLIYDNYPSVYWAEIGQALPRTLSISFSVLYLLYILYSAFEFESTTSPSTIKSVSFLRIDLICIFLMLLPIGTFIPLAYFTGYFADIDQITMANTFYRIQLVSWIIFCIGYLTAIILFWHNRHNLINLETNEKRQKIKYGNNFTFSLQILSVCLYLLSFISYGTLSRTSVIFNYGVNITFLVIWNYFVPFLIQIMQWTMIYKTFVSESTSNINNKNNKNSKGSTNLPPLSPPLSPPPPLFPPPPPSLSQSSSMHFSSSRNKKTLQQRYSYNEELLSSKVNTKINIRAASLNTNSLFFNYYSTSSELITKAGPSSGSGINNNNSNNSSPRHSKHFSSYSDGTNFTSRHSNNSNNISNNNNNNNDSGITNTKKEFKKPQSVIINRQ